MACLTPIKIKAKKRVDGMIRQQGTAIVPCGKCPKCKEKRAYQWVFRLLKEEKIHQNALFITLTYAPENLPITPKGYGTLVKKDYQDFMKRLRKRARCKTIKYYACGEYGTKSWRPHYHAIIYDVDKETIDKCWKHGSIWVGDVTQASIGYTTKYICKEKRIPQHQNDDRLPEFSLMSKKLGKNYLSDAMIKWHRENMASYVVFEGGHKAPLPRYYRNFIFDEEQRSLLNYQTQLQQHQQFEAAVTAAGSVKQYYRDAFESVRHRLKHGFKQQNRDTI